MDGACSACEEEGIESSGSWLALAMAVPPHADARHNRLCSAYARHVIGRMHAGLRHAVVTGAGLLGTMLQICVYTCIHVPMYTDVTSAKKAVLYRQAEAETVVLVNCLILPSRGVSGRVGYELAKGETAVQ